jgi:ABC-2 type transport system ATP-binding protein
VFAAGLIHSPSVAFLDRPPSAWMSRFGAHPPLRDRVQPARGATILLTSHYMDDVVALCKRMIVIHRGRLFATARSPISPTGWLNTR